jgi:DNA polymerase-1
MIRIKDTLGGEPVYFHGVQSAADLTEVWEFAEDHKWLALDTESTGVNPYVRGWELRTFQIGDAYDSYVIPARFRKFIAGIMRLEINWIGHNGPHDIRSIDRWLGFPTGVVCAGETYIPAHHSDSRKQMDGGVGHGLKVQAERFISHDAGKWEDNLKAAFKTIQIPIEGEVYKSGPRKGKQKNRKAKLSEGWALIDPTHPAYIAYAAADPILTYQLWRHYQPVLRENLNLYRFDKRVQEIGDVLARRGFLLDTKYTKRLHDEYTRQAEARMEEAERLGCSNINSGAQIASALEALGVVLTARTPTGKPKTDDKILRACLEQNRGTSAGSLIECILAAKQMLKRRESYTEAMLRNRDESDRVHMSLNTLGARTSRMSVSEPPLLQLPTKDREKDNVREAADIAQQTRRSNHSRRTVQAG